MNLLTASDIHWEFEWHFVCLWVSVSRQRRRLFSVKLNPPEQVFGKKRNEKEIFEALRMELERIDRTNI